MPDIQTLEARGQIDSNVLAQLLGSLAGSLHHLVIHINPALGWNTEESFAPSYRLTENTALQSIQVHCDWDLKYREMYKSVITNLIGSICSPHLRSLSIILTTVVDELEHFPWEVVDKVTKVSPLQRVEIALSLLAVTDPIWASTAPLSHDIYETYFRQVRSALPELGENVIMRIASSEDIPPDIQTPFFPSDDDDDDDYYDYDIDYDIEPGEYLWESDEESFPDYFGYE